MTIGNSSLKTRPTAAIAIALVMAGAGEFLATPTVLAGSSRTATSAPLARAVEIVEQAKLFFGRRDWAHTVELAEQAARIDPTYSRPHVYIGLAREQQRRPDLARAAYLKVLAMIPAQALSDPRRREDLAMARRRLKSLAVTKLPSSARPRPAPRSTLRPAPAARKVIVPSPMKLQWKGETIALSITPVLLRGNLMVPFGDVFKAAGGQTTYDALTRSVTAQLPTEGERPATTIRIVINRRWADVNGKTVALDVPALDYRDYAMVPLSFVTNVLHAQPEYDFTAEIINIRPNAPDATPLTTQTITAPRLFNPAGLKEWHTIPAAHAGGVRTIAWSPDGKLLASGGADKTVKLWSMPAGTLKATLPLLGGEVRAVVFSPDGSTLASGSADKTVRLWDVVSGELKNTFTFPAAVDALAFSPDKALLVVAISETRAGIAGEGEVRLIDAATGAVQSASTLISNAQSVAFSPDNRTWAATDGTYPVVLGQRDTRDTRAPHALKGWRRGASALSFSPDGKWIACGGVDGIVRICEVGSGNLKRELPALPNGVLSVAFSPDGFSVAAGADDGSLHFWRME